MLRYLLKKIISSILRLLQRAFFTPMLYFFLFENFFVSQLGFISLNLNAVHGILNAFLKCFNTNIRNIIEAFRRFKTNKIFFTITFR